MNKQHKTDIFMHFNGDSVFDLFKLNRSAL